jgi:hypothetical protein
MQAHPNLADCKCAFAQRPASGKLPQMQLPEPRMGIREIDALSFFFALLKHLIFA